MWMQRLVKFGQNYLGVKMMNNINFQELLQGIQDAQEYLEKHSKKTFEELVEEYLAWMGNPTGTETTGIKRAKPWLYAKGEDKDSNLLALINQMLQDPEPEMMQMGGQVGMGSMAPGRRMYNMPQRRRPQMQTSQQGMPMRGSRGLQQGNPLMYKKGGSVKYHV